MKIRIFYIHHVYFLTYQFILWHREFCVSSPSVSQSARQPLMVQIKYGYFGGNISLFIFRIILIGLGLFKLDLIAFEWWIFPGIMWIPISFNSAHMCGCHWMNTCVHARIMPLHFSQNFLCISVHHLLLHGRTQAPDKKHKVSVMTINHSPKKFDKENLRKRFSSLSWRNKKNGIMKMRKKLLNVNEWMN